MDKKENCIQLKIDTIIGEINRNYNENEQNDEKNQITSLIGYNHCIDLYDFLKLYSKVQKNELLFQTAIIYDSIGYSELSMEYIDQALLLIPNAPTLILYKSGLFASRNKFDEAQKWLLKYKYLIGENKYDNYIHDSFQTILYFLLEYEEFIILRNIKSMEDKYSKYVKENFVIYFIKSQILEKLAQKIKNTDNKRYISYLKEINKIKNTYLKKKKVEREFLEEQGIRPENVTKLLYFMSPIYQNYRPKKLDEYKNNFIKSGFSLFYTLIKISKIFKFKIELNKFKKNHNNEQKNNINNLFVDSTTSLNETNELKKNISMEANKESIKHLYNSVWLKDYIHENKNNKNIEIKPLDSKTLNINYFTREGYYSHLNIDDNIVRLIKYNNDYNQHNFKDDLSLEELTLGENEQKSNSKKDNITLNNFESFNKVIPEPKTICNTRNNIFTINSKKNSKRTQNASPNSKFKRIKLSLSQIIKKVINKRPKENHKNKRNKIINNNENDVKSKKFCSTDNFNNLIHSKNITNNTINKNKKNMIKIDSNTMSAKKIYNDENNNNNNNQKEKENLKIIDEKESKNEKKFGYTSKEERNKNKTEKNIKVIDKNNINNNFFIGLNKKEIKNINNKNKLLSSNTSNKKLSLINTKDKSKTINKNTHKNYIFCYGDEKKMDTDYGKYKDTYEVNLVSYCLRNLIKKRENKNKKRLQKEIINLTDKMDVLPPQKIINFEKQVLQIHKHRFLKSRSNKKKFLNQTVKNQLNQNTFNSIKKIPGKYTQKSSQNNILKPNKNSYSSNALNSNNSKAKNLKKSGINNNSKKELSKFKSLNYLYGNFNHNNYLNINFNNYMNYNYNNYYSNRHEDKKNLDFKFSQNSEQKKNEPKEKANFHTINLDFKNISTKLNSHNKQQLLNSFIDSKDKKKKTSDKNVERVIMPFNKIKNSPSSQMYCLKKKIIKSNLIKQKTKTSFSKYMLYNMGKKGDGFYFSKSINMSEYIKYKNSSINKSKNQKSKYNKTISSNSNMKIKNK